MQGDRVVREEWAARGEQAVRGIVGEPAAGIALATVAFKAVPGVEIAAPLEAALASTVTALDPAATAELPAWEVRGVAVVRAAAAAVGDNLTNVEKRYEAQIAD